ncbi:hypothetical protein [Helicobacter sp. T3_23-1056]
MTENDIIIVDCHESLARFSSLLAMTKQYCHIEVSQETEISLLHCGFRDISLTLNMTKATSI